MHIPTIATLDGSFTPLPTGSAHATTIFANGYLPQLEEINPEVHRLLKRNITGIKLVELGAGVYHMSGLWDFRPSSVHLVDPSPLKPLYDGVELPSCSLFRQSEHGLAFLRGISAPAIVVSSGMMKDGIIDEDYTRSIAREIHRVTPSGGITMHESNEDYFVDAFAAANLKLVDRVAATNWRSVPFNTPPGDQTYYIFEK